MTALLDADGLITGYGRSQVLYGMQIKIKPGQCVALLGRNGMGKTTTVKTIMGIHPCWDGKILFNGKEIQGQASYKIAQLGIGLVPEGRQVFPNLTVYENLVATAANRQKRSSYWDLKKVYDLFPRLKERSSHFGNQLSGGEQQMLAIGRALMTNPELLVLDEATEGLSPLIRKEIWGALAALRQDGMSILVIDKNLAPLLALADYHYIIEKGQIVWTGNSAELKPNLAIQRKYLGA